MDCFGWMDAKTRETRELALLCPRMHIQLGNSQKESFPTSQQCLDRVAPHTDSTDFTRFDPKEMDNHSFKRDSSICGCFECLCAGGMMVLLM